MLTHHRCKNVVALSDTALLAKLEHSDMIILEVKYVSLIMSGESMQQSYKALDRVAQDKDCEAQLHGIAVAKSIANMEGL